VVGEGSRTLNRNITISATSTASGVWARLGQLDSGTSTFGGGVTINRSGLLPSSGTSGSGRANFTGALTGANGITVVGNGIVGLSSTSSSFSGTTTVRSGVLVVGTTAPAAGNGALGNASSAIRLGDTTIASGSVKAATTSTITVTGSLNASDSNFGGATLVNGDRVIVWRQTTAGQNGIYTWNSSNGLLTLAESGSAAGVYGSQYLVTSGSFANQRFWINTSNATTTGFVPDDIANPNVSLLVSAPVTIGRAIQVVSNSSSGVSAIGGSLTSGTATFTGNVALDRGVTLQAATGGTVRIENAIGGTGGLTLNNGLLELFGANTYTGATTVNAGRLLVTGQLGNTAVTVNSGGLLGGSGSIGGAVTIAGGTLSPGSSPGQISIASLVLQPSSTVFMEMTGTTAVTQYDRISLTGGLTYDGTLQLDLSQNFADNTTFNLFSGFTSASGNLAGIVSSGSFYNGLAFTRTDNLWKSTAAPNGQTLEFNQTTGNLVIVPEPGAIALAAIGIAAAAWSLRRRKA
jgi:autotransporter-associated beta strand protein